MSNQVIVQKHLDLMKEPLVPIFARHESFHPRYGWLKKGFDLSVKYPDLFTREDSSVLLGVGKNMVRSIRYWCQAFKLVKEVFDEQTKKKVFVPTEFGLKLLADDGWDPYLEDPNSLWLLHWQLLKNPCLGTTWYYFFNFFRHADFSSDELVNEIKEFTAECFPKTPVALSSLQNDVSCLLRMYGYSRSFGKAAEDSIDCPFSEIGLVENAHGTKRFSFQFGHKSTLSPSIVAIATLDFCSIAQSESTTVNLSRLLFEPGSPGCIFKLSESELCAALEVVAGNCPSFSLTETAGLIQLQYLGSASDIRDQLLVDYYKSA